MIRVIRRHWPALVLGCVALIAALGGTVYAAGKINGHRIKPKSLPGNRLATHSLPGNRLKIGAIPGNRLAPGSITGAQIDAGSLGRVPSSARADYADTAGAAATALSAAHAADADAVNGYEVGCGGDTRPYAGACWQRGYHAARKAPDAAAACAAAGGELPSALALAAFAREPGVELAADDEWSGDVANAAGPETFSLMVVSAKSGFDYAPWTESHPFRCVIPLVR